MNNIWLVFTEDDNRPLIYLEEPDGYTYLKSEKVILCNTDNHSFKELKDYERIKKDFRIY